MVIIGINGKMGRSIYEQYKNSFDIIGIDKISHFEAKTICDLDLIEKKIDVLVDFSSIECFDMLVKAIRKGIPVLSGTTGYSLDEINILKELALTHNVEFVWKANYAKGIKLFSKLINVCKNEFEKLDFVEIHATTKKDSPSGTAKILAKELGVEEAKIQSLRLNQAPAIHELIFSSDFERLSLRHEILDKKAFLMGFDEELKNIVGEG